MLKRFFHFSGTQRKSAGIAQPSPELIALFGGAPSAAGVTVTPESSLRCPTVYASVKVLAESVSQLPLHLYRRTDDGGKERASDHPLAELLNGMANEWTDATDFRLAMQTALCLHGNAFAFINRSGGQITELIHIPTRAVTVLTDSLTLEPSYRISSEGGVRDYSFADILHLKTLGTEPNVGLSPVMQARDAIGLSMAMEQHAGKLSSQGARPSGVFKYSKTLGPDAMQRLRDSFNAGHAGGENAGRTLILEDGMDFAPLQFTAVDMQFLELRRHQVAEIARVFRIPLHLLQELERATHNNAEAMGQQFLSLTLLPWLKIWEAGIRRALLTPEDRKVYFAEFLTDDLARADLAARFAAYAQAVTNGLLSPNEIRASENRTPYLHWADEGFLTLTPGNVVDHSAVIAYLNDLAERFAVQEVVIDRWNSTAVNTALQEDGFTVTQFGQGMGSMSAPVKELKRAILSGHFRHGGSPLLRMCFGNVVGEKDAHENEKFTKAKARGCIDGAVAAAMAVGRIIANEVTPSPHEGRGFAFL